MWIGGHRTAGVDRHLWRQLRAGGPAQENAVQRDAAGRHVEQQRLLAIDGQTKAKWIGAEERLDAAMRNDDGVRMGHPERYKATPCGFDRVAARGTVMRTAPNS